MALLDRMEHEIWVWEKTRDNRSVFLQCYYTMTSNMLLAIEQGRFHDGIWVDQLLNRFGLYYFNALDKYEVGDPAVPKVWQTVFTRSTLEGLHVLQLLLSGVNAHINYDLVLALRDLLQKEWTNMDEVHKNIRYEDHCLVNNIIFETIDKVQAEVVEDHSPAMDIIDKLFGRVDEWLLSRLISNWREDVWEKATELLSLADTVAEQRFITDLEADVMRRGERILLL